MLTQQVKDFSRGYIPSIDGLSTPEGASPNTQEIEFYKGTLRPARALSLFTTEVVTGTPLVLTQFFKTGGAAYLVLATHSGLYNYSGGAWVSIGAYPGTDPRHVSFTVWPKTDNLLITDYENEVKKWDGTTFAGLGGLTNIKAKFIRSFWSHVILGHTIESGVACPLRIRWCNTGDYENWTTGNAGFLDIADTPGFIRRVEYLRDRLLVYKDDSIWECIYIGYPKMFTVSRVTSDIGLLATDTMVEVGGVHYFMGTDNIYSFDGVTRAPIGGQIWQDLYGPNKILSDTSVSKCKATYVPGLDEYWLAVPTVGSVDAKVIYRYNILTQSWWPKKVDNPIYCFGNWKETSSKTWNDLVGLWPAQDWVWGGSSLVTDFPITLVGSATGASKYIKKVDVGLVSTDIADKYWDTSDRSFGDRGRFLSLWIEAEGNGSIEVFYSVNQGLTFSSLGVQTGDLGNWDWLQWSFNFTNTTARFRFKLSGNISIRRYIISGQKRKT